LHGIEHKKGKRLCTLAYDEIPQGGYALVFSNRVAPGAKEESNTSRLRFTNHGTPLPRQPKIKKIMHITRNRKNKTFAIPADAAAMPPNPSTAATNAIIRNVTAQPNMMSPP
jgi:hypothetical protein